MTVLKPNEDWRCWRGVLAGSGALAEYWAEHIAEVDHGTQDNWIELAGFNNYEEEAAFWDNLNTADMMEDDGEWFHFSTSCC